MATIGYSTTNAIPSCTNNTATFYGWKASDLNSGAANVSVPCKCPCSVGRPVSISIQNSTQSVYPVDDSSGGGTED
jgi:hypothetical protein